jgi:hypothetical protein
MGDKKMPLESKISYYTYENSEMMLMRGTRIWSIHDWGKLWCTDFVPLKIKLHARSSPARHAQLHG